MEISLADQWLSEMEMEDFNNLFYEYQTNNFHSLSSKTYHLNNTQLASHHGGVERPVEQVSCTTKKITPSSSLQIISFENMTMVNPKTESDDGDIDFPTMISYEQQYMVEETKRIGSISTRNAQEHVTAERKRREKLSQLFIELSALVPGRHKVRFQNFRSTAFQMDKASILGDSIKYLKQLEEDVKALEEQVAKRTMELSTMTIIKKSHICYDDECLNRQSELYLPEIEARISEKDVLIRIYCEKTKGCVENILHKIEKLHFTVIGSNVLPFGNSILHITVVGQMEIEHGMTVKDIVKNLRLSLLQYM